MTTNSNSKASLLAARPILRAVSFALLPAAVLMVTGCGMDNHTARILSDPEKAHPIRFSSETETLYVELPHAGGGLSHNQAADVRRFVERYKAESNSGLKIAAPRTAGGRFAVARSMRQVEDIVTGAGIPSGAVHTTDYSGRNPEFGPAVRIAYRRPISQPPYCEDWSKDLGVDRERLPHSDFGCATQRNLALTVANARDLQSPQQVSPRSSERRSVTWTEYVGGGSSSSGGATGSSSVSGGAGSPTPTTP